MSHHNIIDLTTLINENIHCYPTDPRFKKTWHAEYDRDGVYVSKLSMGSHCGTHVDAPLHFYKGGDDICSLAPAAFMGPAIAIDTPKQTGQDITAENIAEADIREGDIVLFRTGWEERACTAAFFQGEWPGFTPQAVELLIEMKAKAIGGDIASADSPRMITQGSPAHIAAAKANLPIFEALVNMKSIIGKRFHFIGLPLKIENAEASPIRAIAILEQ